MSYCSYIQHFGIWTYSAFCELPPTESSSAYSIRITGHVLVYFITLVMRIASSFRAHMYP